MKRKLSRAQFLKLFSGVFLFFGMSQWMLSCASEKKSDDDDGDNGGGGTDPKPDCINAGTKISISGNHGHTLSVSKADVAAGTEKTYNITGSSAHSHSVTITAEHFAQLAANTSIVITSTPSGHSHQVTVSCALA
ncbi:MAG TPA: hypothetical protein PKO47_01875 [bacterium]|nr:hypothetical protein [bacterium]HNB10252.1 hypothetical protein [bacterium]HNH30648.1 hypothetical protein [bacterium]HNL25507.1 hypothetical protein [bacterium]